MRPRLPKADAEGYIRRHRPDYAFVLITSLLLIFGAVVVYTISPALDQSAVLYRQLLHIGLAALAFGVASVIPLTFWRKIYIPILLAGLLASLLLLVPALSIEVNGATRWLNLGIFSFQPAELLKFGLVIYLATWLSERARTNRLDNVHDTLVSLMIITAVLGVIVAGLQKDLGTMIALASIILSMLFVSGIKISHFGRYIAALAAAGLAATVMFPHRLARISTFLDHSQDVDGAGYHINQALIAIGSGGWFGRGLGKSVQVFGYLPEAINDSIFAIIAEQFGFVGSLLVLFLYGALAVRLLKLIERSPNLYLRLLAAGIFGWLVSHVLINVGAMLGLVPLTGITLPFLSLGGTSLIFITAAFGMAFNMSRYSSLSYAKEGENAHLASRRGNRWTRSATSSARLRT
jgi:cell division protein FtsW